MLYCFAGLTIYAVTAGGRHCGVVWCGVVWCGVVWCGVVLGHIWNPHSMSLINFAEYV